MQKHSKSFKDTGKSIGMIGAGPVGSLLSVYLAQRGMRTEIFERRGDMRLEKVVGGRSINLAVSVRGLHALREIGLESQILDQAVPMMGRMIHSQAGELTFQRYGMNDSECIYSISREGLNKSLMSVAEETGLVRIHFNERAAGIDFETNTLNFKNERTEKESCTAFDVVIGTDGSASALRKDMMQIPGYHMTQNYLDYGYKELVLPAGEEGQFLIEKNALHIWPRGAFMLIALPNFDGSFTCTLFLHRKGLVSFESLGSESAVREFFQVQFPDMVSLTPELVEMFFSNPTGNMVTVKCAPWNVGGKTLLVGDAAHAIVPFFGQGMNCGFEDCTLLNELLDTQESWHDVFSAFSESRKPHTDGIADMAVENFIEMRDKVGNKRFLLEKAVEKILQQQFPTEYVSRYSLVTFSRVPYQVAYKAGVIENEILRELCQNIEAPEEVNLEMAKGLIRTQLSPLLTSHIESKET